MESKFSHSVSLLCWAYNEEASISEYLEKASQLMNSAVDDYEIILIDDGSTDGTYEIAKVFQDKNPKLKIFQNERNLNVGISNQRAIQRASKEYLFWQTIDWSYDISNLCSYLEYLKKYDIVQGVRSPLTAKIKFLKLFNINYFRRRSDTVMKGIISIVNFIFIRILFRAPLSDFQNVTFYPTKWVQSIKIESNSSFVNPELLLKSYWNGKSIKEVPINFIPRVKGKPKGTKLTSIANSIKDIFRLWFKWIILGKRERVNKGKIYALNSLY